MKTFHTVQKPEHLIQLNYERGLLLYALISKFKPKNILEIGAGYGTNLLFFKNIGKEVFGLEPSKISTKIAIDNQINIKQGFVNDLENKYDMIILKHVFEHLYDPLKDLEKISNEMKLA